MTALLLVLWLILTRAGSKRPVWPAREMPKSATPVSSLPLDPAAVSLEAGVAAVAMTLIPWAALSDLFAPWERIWFVVLWPIVLRYGLDRVAKLRAGHLARATPEGLFVPGLPRRRVRWTELEAISIRKVLFGPDDLVFESGRVPVTLDTQFTTFDERELIEWAMSLAEANTPK